MLESQDSQSPQDTNYAHLVERAVQFVVNRGGAAPEDALIAYVFGATTAPGIWRDLLARILSGDERVSRTSDGVWINPGPKTSTQSTAFDFAVIDVETTGLRPRHHRITEIALLLIDADGSQSTWSTVVNPERSIPAQITKITGLRNQDVAHAPLFRSVAATVLDLIGNRVIVGHNVEFDVGFLNAELRRAGQSGLVNPLIDTISLADSLCSGLRRLALADVAAALGIPTSESHRAMPDAMTTLSIFQRLAADAIEQGHGALGDLLEIGEPKRRRQRGEPASSRGRALLDRSLIDGVPNFPGIYIMRDGNDRVIYVGKAKALRRRLNSYFSEPLGHTRKMDGLLGSIESIEVEVVGSELEALVLESELIRRYRPRFNRQQRNVEQYVYIKVDIANRWPTVSLAKDRDSDGARYYGPYRSQRAAKEAVQLINDVLPLRTCRRSFKDARSLGKPCIELEMKRCLGPCVRLADPEIYFGHIRNVLAFFEGDHEPLLELLHNRLELAAEHLDFEKAAQLRNHIDRLDRIRIEQDTIQGASTVERAVLVLPGAEPGSRQLWVLVRGRRWAALNIAEHDEASEVADRLTPIFQRAARMIGAVQPDHHSVEEMALISRWIRRTPDHPALIEWSAESSAADVAKRVLEVDFTIPFGTPTDEGNDVVEGVEELI